MKGVEIVETKSVFVFINDLVNGKYNNLKRSIIRKERCDSIKNTVGSILELEKQIIQMVDHG